MPGDPNIAVAAIAGTPPAGDWLSDRERAVLERLARPERRATWLAGRWLAKETVRGMEGVCPHEVEILAAADGAPELWVGGCLDPRSLSISHRAGWVGVALAHEFGTFVGFDLERIETRTAAFISDFLSARERIWVLSHAEPELAANLVWSAKEAALKALRTGLRRDTRSIEVAVTGARLEARDTMTAALYRGHWRRHTPEMLWTVVTRPRDQIGTTATASSPGAAANLAKSAASTSGSSGSTPAKTRTG